MPKFLRPLAGLALLSVALLAALGCGGAVAGSDSQETVAPSLLPDTIKSPLLARLNGEDLTFDDLDDRVRWQMAQLRNEYYTEAHRVLEEGAVNLARQRLLEAAAEAEGMSLNQYYNETIGIPEVSDEELEQIYNQNIQQLGGQPLDQIAGDLRRQIANQKLNRAIDMAGHELMSEAEWDLMVPAFRLEIETEGHASLGPDDAPVKVVVFSDFECPYCKRFNTTMDRLREEYTDQIQIVFRHYPLRQIHPQAQKASEAAICAGDQGTFWEYHDALWAGDGLGLDTLEQHARLLGLDTEAFAECLNSGRHYEQVQNDLETALGLGQSGTPAVFANGRYLGGAIGYEQLRVEIDRDIEAATR